MTGVGSQVGTITAVRIAGPGREMLPGDEPFDVFLEGDAIADIAPAGVLPPRGEVLDGDGAHLVPGLWDHHVHMLQWSLMAERVDLGGVRTAAEAAALMGAAPLLADGRRIGTGFRDGLWTDIPSLAVLDAATGDIPTYLLNADAHSVWLNSAALRREGRPAAGDGVLREEPAFEIQRRLNDIAQAEADLLIGRAAASAAARGVVGLVDLDMVWNADAWGRRAADGFDTLRVEFGIYPADLDRAIAAGLRTGDPQGSDLVRVGGLKVITDGSLGTRTAACSHPYAGDPQNFGTLTVDPADLVEMMTDATGAGLRCAVHAIGDVANSEALDAFAATGAWGTIEHAQLVAHADIPRFARLGVGASVQPEHAVDDRDLTDRYWAGQTALAYPLRSLADAGANLLLGSDAPVSQLDPWAGIASAVYRARDGREPWQPAEAISIPTALAASTHGGSTDAARIEPGGLADLALCEADPLVADEQTLRGMRVRATLLGGRVTHHA